MASNRELLKQAYLRSDDYKLILRMRQEKVMLVNMIKEIHEYYCGCDKPGTIDVCVAQPVVFFAILTDDDILA